MKILLQDVKNIFVWFRYIFICFGSENTFTKYEQVTLTYIFRYFKAFYATIFKNKY